MNCPHCGTELKQGAVFCPNCGKAVPAPDAGENAPAGKPAVQGKNNRKTLAIVLGIVGGVLVIAAGVIAGFLFFQRPPEPVPVAEPSATLEPAQLPDEVQPSVTPASSSEAAEEPEEILKEYTAEEIAPEGMAAEQEATVTGPGQKWFDPTGVACARIADLDGDGQDELLVCHLSEGDPAQWMITVCEVVDGETVIAAQMPFKGYAPKGSESWYTDDSLSADLTDEMLVGMYLKQSDGAYYIVGEHMSSAVFADGGTRNYWMMLYLDGKLFYDGALTQTAGGSDGFVHTHYSFGDRGSNKHTEEEVFYAMDYTADPEGYLKEYKTAPHYKDFDSAISGFFYGFATTVPADSKPSSKPLSLCTDQLDCVFLFSNEAVDQDYDTGKVTFHAELEYDGEPLEEGSTSGGDSKPKPTETPAEADWKQAYIKTAGLADEETRKMGYYTLLDIDGDNIPEMYIDTETTAGGSDLFTWKNGHVEEMHLYTGGLSYIPGGNLFVDRGGHMDGYYDSVYTIKDGKFSEIVSGSYGAKDNSHVEVDADGKPIYEYYWDNVKVASEAEYEKKLNQAIDLSRTVRGFDFEKAKWDDKQARYVGDHIYRYDEFLQAIKDY